MRVHDGLSSTRGIQLDLVFLTQAIMELEASVGGWRKCVIAKLPPQGQRMQLR